MMLSNVDILRAIDSGEIAFNPPLEQDRIKLASVELGLGRFAWKSRSHRHSIDLTTEESRKLEVKPGDFVTFTIHERVKLSNKYAARIGGLSYFNELGLFVFPGTQVEPGFDGRLTVAAINFSGKTILVKHKSPICSLEIVGLETPADFGEVKKPFYFDIEAAVEVLENTPHEKAGRSPEDIEAAEEILRRIDAEPVIDTEGWQDDWEYEKRIYR